MKLVAAPEVVLEVLIERAGRLSQQELSAVVTAARRECVAIPGRRAASNLLRAAAALRALMVIDEVSEPVREQLERVRQRVEVLLTAEEPTHCRGSSGLSCIRNGARRRLPEGKPARAD
jgi:hypothetical protein